MDETRRVIGGAAARGFFGGGEPAEVASRTWFIPAFANVSLFETGEGLLMVDTSSANAAPRVHSSARALTAAPLHTVVYTHGHVDHAFGLEPWLEEPGFRPRIVAHSNVVRRFREYGRMAGLNEHINRIQFGVDSVVWPRDFFWPDTLYDTALTLSLAGERFELRHGRGETDDATWVWAPERKVLCTGDFWISCAPNCGNPQKVQRYAEDWADTLEAMAGLGAGVLLPGHGPAVTGRDAIAECLTDACAYLRSIIEQTLAALNAGLDHQGVVAAVRVPEDLAAKPYLRAIYDRPEFIVRNLIRLHGGWWDGRPADLLPAPASEVASEVASLAGGVDAVVARARELADSNPPLACHLAEWAALADPANKDAQTCVRDVFRARADAEESLMGRGIFMHAVRQARAALGES